VYPHSPFIRKYLFGFGLWQFAIGAFNPLFNAYFARELHASVEQIGNVFAASQFIQACAVLIAPLILRRAGVIAGTSGIQIAGACCLAALAAGPATLGAAIAYAAFMSCQTMVEPGMFSTLMSRVAPHERSGASGLNFFVMFGAHGVAAAIAGWAAAHAGYTIMLLVAATIAAGSALLFRMLLRSQTAAEPVSAATGSD
jgi:predicted MFS family arabinose efflux permease